MHGRSKLLVVYWSGLSVQVKVRVRTMDGKWILFLLFFFSALKNDEHLMRRCHLWQCGVSVT